MEIFNIFLNPFGMVMFILPILTFGVALVAQLIIKKKAIILSLVFGGYVVFMLTCLNTTFFIWCLIYTAIAWGGTCVADGIRTRKN